MKPRKPTGPSHVDLVRQADRERPPLSWRERQAISRLCFSRAKNRKPTGWDPLEQRMGLQADLRQRRPYYAIWSPMYHEILRNRPQIDDSLPGAAWLATVYRGSRRDDVTLPGVRAVLRAREQAANVQYATPARPAPATPRAPQAELFEEPT